MVLTLVLSIIFSKRCSIRFCNGRTKVNTIEPRADGIHVNFEFEGKLDSQVYDRVLIAIGRRPNGKAIKAELAGVNVTDKGFIPANKQMRTNVSHIFAIGDIVGQPMLAHKATHEGKVAAEVIAGLKVDFSIEHNFFKTPLHTFL